MQAPIERTFWELEQCKGQLADQLANEGAMPFSQAAPLPTQKGAFDMNRIREFRHLFAGSPPDHGDHPG